MGHTAACPFVIDDAYSDYAVRPLASRVLFKLDDDDLLCRHSAPQLADVPYTDSCMRALALAAQQAATLGYIRDFFPLR